MHYPDVHVVLDAILYGFRARSLLDRLYHVQKRYRFCVGYILVFHLEMRSTL